MAAIDFRQYDNLITAADVVKMAMTNANMDSSIIDSNTILIAEITHLKEHLGDYFWGKLRQGGGSSYTWSNEEATLMTRYIRPCLALYVKYEVLNDMQYNTTSSGVVTNDDDWSDPVDGSEMSILKDDTFRKAEILKEDMMRFIQDPENKGVYANYENIKNTRFINGDNVKRIGGILAYGNKRNNSIL